MTKTLTKHGNSLALVIDKPVLELLHIDDETQLDISTDGQVLIVSPIHNAKDRERVLKAYEHVGRKHHAVLKRLAG